MAELTAQDAVARALAELGSATETTAQTWLVERLDRTDDRYYLVVLYAAESPVAVAAIGAIQGELRSAARLGGGGAPIALSADQALARAGATQDAKADLVWRPCRASLSPLYPLWRVRMAAGTRYVDQQGAVLQSLEPAGPGG